MSNDNSSNFMIILVLGLVCLGIYVVYLLVIWATKVFVYLGYNSFFYLDNLFGINPFNPIVVWSIWGLFIGSIIGVTIAVKKHKLSKILILYPVGFVILLFTIMGFVNHPSDYKNNYMPPQENKVVVAPKNYYTLTMDANVRSGPSKNNSVLFVLNKGMVVEVIQKGSFDSRNAEWYKIRNENREGFISAKLLTFSHTQ